jgi:hypothetical protein
MRCSSVAADSACRTSRSPTTTALQQQQPCSQRAGCRIPWRGVARLIKSHVRSSLNCPTLACPPFPSRLSATETGPNPVRFCRTEPGPRSRTSSPSGDAPAAQLRPTGQDNGWRNLRRVACSSRGLRLNGHIGRRTARFARLPCPRLRAFAVPDDRRLCFFLVGHDNLSCIGRQMALVGGMTLQECWCSERASLEWAADTLTSPEGLLSTDGKHSCRRTAKHAIEESIGERRSNK